ncbi:glutamine--fructose-6-phosphate transaminase (isomerizing) [Neomegalonema perideroedes]|uniref:glutamine--fructose-6-phosphate transaminase (isomerizing) n=1 Tax=Neomegalonema perideroedes TaxID=217219 RepID=UPI0003634D54|nr:glutamine--fructose-6-phosphate transaminase (isomerizing) [Neomegalonema perideroedes]
MCGIVGVIGREDAAATALEALRRLEYRGYDSAGLATLEEGRLTRRRAPGKLSALASLLESYPLHGALAVGHTRWATHGAPTEANAHPHQAGRVMVVHNGIIENFRELRAELQAEGRVFESETDTEVAAHLCDSYMARGLSPADAAAATLGRIQGAFALCFLFEGHEDLMIAARRGSPLALGYGEGAMYVGSDALALAPMTNRIAYLEEGDWAILRRQGAEIFDREGRPAERAVRTVAVESVLADKGEYRHFMAKEIHEQPGVLGYVLGRYLSADRRSLAALDPAVDFAAASSIQMVACGTAAYAAQTASYWFNQMAGLPAHVEVASEFRYREPPLPEGGMALFVSQSGETADTLAALRYAKSQDQKILGVVNVPESSIARESDLVLPTLAGPEIGVASTKAFVCQLTVLAVLAAQAGRARGKLSPEAEAEFVAGLNELPRLISETLALEPQIAKIAREIAEARDALYLGRGAMHPLAMEGALKLKEISYIHAEGYAAGELKHGPIALVDPHVPVVVMAPRDALFEKTVSNMQEVMARGGKVLLISDAEGVAEAGEGVWASLTLPKVHPRLAPILYAVPAQLLAYHAALAKGADVDQPRNLAKSVTVE